jgi:uncharacterized protein
MKSIRAMNWNEIMESLNTKGYAIIPEVLSKPECEHLRGFYDDDQLFRSVISMERYRFGKGEYKYFNYPLPPSIQVLREGLYQPLSTLANEWMQKLGVDMHYPEQHQQLLERCKAKNQHRPTPLILRYQHGGYNTLHQDLYGEVYFPFQVVFVLTQHGVDHEGGDFVLTEQLPRAQSKAEVIRPNQGDAVIFTTNLRPVAGKNGFYKTRVKHGVSEVKHGQRFALGLIFHDAS